MDMTITEFIFNVIGIAGVLCILYAYCLLQANILNNSQLRFQFLNLGGAILIIISLFCFWNLASFVIELAWAIISIWGIYKIIKQRYYST